MPLKKIYRLPEIIKNRKTFQLISFHPHYDDSFIIKNENTFRIEPIALLPKIKKFVGFRPEMFVMSDYQRRKWQKLSGRYAYIYALIDENNIPIYIGSTKSDIKIRHSQHKVKPVFRKTNIVELCKVPVEFQFEEEKRWILGAKKIYQLKNTVQSWGGY